MVFELVMFVYKLFDLVVLHFHNFILFSSSVCSSPVMAAGVGGASEFRSDQRLEPIRGGTAAQLRSDGAPASVRLVRGHHHLSHPHRHAHRCCLCFSSSSCLSDVAAFTQTRLALAQLNLVCPRQAAAPLVSRECDS